MTLLAEFVKAKAIKAVPFRIESIIAMYGVDRNPKLSSRSETRSWMDVRNKRQQIKNKRQHTNHLRIYMALYIYGEGQLEACKKLLYDHTNTQK